MKTQSVILLESNAAVLSQLKLALEESEEFSVVHAGDDGDIGIKEILSIKPDIVIVGMFLKGADGSAVIKTVKKTWSDAKIIAVGISNDSLIEKAMEEGATYYLVKPFSITTAIERIREIAKNKKELEEQKIREAEMMREETVQEEESERILIDNE